MLLIFGLNNQYYFINFYTQISRCIWIVINEVRNITLRFVHLLSLVKSNKILLFFLYVIFLSVAECLGIPPYSDSNLFFGVDICLVSVLVEKKDIKAK